MGVPWIKITTNIFDDEKIKLIDSMPEHDTILVVWIKLLTLAGKCNASGVLLISDSIPYTDEMLAAVFNRPLNIIKLALEAFERLEMIERHDSIVLVNWEKHQNEAALSTIREYDKNRKRIQRNNLKALPCPGTVPDKSRNVRILDIDLDKDKDKDKDIREDAPIVAILPKETRFRKPTVEEVESYCLERRNAINPEQFVNYYDSKGWKIGNAGMKDWRAAVRTWEANDKKYAPKAEAGYKFDPKDYNDI